MEDQKSNKSKAVGVGILGLAIGGLIGYVANELFSDKENKTRKESKELIYEQQDTDLESIQCPICSLRLRDPVILSSCGHTFDKKCILEWSERRSTCPLCNVRFQRNDIRSNYALKEYIDQFK